jgi:hypothetical protein
MASNQPTPETTVYSYWIGHGLILITSRYALSDLRKLNFQPLLGLPATQAMEGLGITDGLQASLTDPHFSDLSRSETLRYWLTDTMKIRYATPNKLLEKQRRKVSSIFDSDASSPTPSQPTATYSSAILLEDTLSHTYVATQAAPPALPDHYILYKDKAVKYMSEWFVLEDGIVNIASIETYGGVQRSMVCHWSRQEETAEKYTQWCEIRCPGLRPRSSEFKSWNYLWAILERTMSYILAMEKLCSMSLWTRKVVERLAMLVRGKIHIEICPAAIVMKA